MIGRDDRADLRIGGEDRRAFEIRRGSLDPGRISRRPLRSPSVTKAPLLRFLGAARTVTGSRFLLTGGGATVLVDCGMFQGTRALRQLNWSDPPVDPAAIDAVVLTHAHLDHVGYLPVLMRHGFSGQVWSATWTPELARIVLSDSGHLQEEEAEFANRKGFSKHHPALPLYTQAEGEKAAGLIAGAALDTPVDVAPGVRAVFRTAGHILGSACVTIELAEGRRILFSGDLGRPRHPLLMPPAAPDPADVLVVESTYGNRRHEDTGAAMQRLADAITRTAARGGTVVIPAFAVDRTEVLLAALAELLAAGSIPELPVYVDSPMASAVLGVYRRAATSRDPEIHEDVDAARVLRLGGGLVESTTREQSMAIDALNAPAIVISSSGMATGGRVLHHLERRLPDHRNTVVLAGYQADGTRGRTLADGARAVKIHGHYVPVRAEVLTVDAFSVHADAGELLAWMGSGADAPEVTYVVHGETDAATTLADRVSDELHRLAVVPSYGEKVRLD